MWHRHVHDRLALRVGSGVSGVAMHGRAGQRSALGNRDFSFMYPRVDIICLIEMSYDA
jgi:hypothetical protein